jgi:hypothetical protein
MKRLIVGLLTFAIVAAPCVYDMFSAEPSALSGLLAASVLPL